MPPTPLRLKFIRVILPDSHFGPSLYPPSLKGWMLSSFWGPLYPASHGGGGLDEISPKRQRQALPAAEQAGKFRGDPLRRGFIIKPLFSDMAFSGRWGDRKFGRSDR